MDNGTLPEGPIETPDPHAAPDLQKVVDILARLAPAEAEQYRRQISKKFGIRLASLDAMIRERRRELESELAGNSILPPDPEPWPEPVAGAELLGSIRETFKKHVILPENGDVALALWSVGTYCFDEFRIWPRLLVTSPEKRCGKTSLLEALAAITKRSLPSSNISAAAMFRVIDKLQPTLLIDEADCFLDSSEELAAIVNSGHSRTAAFVLKCDGDSHDVKRFTTWASMAICMIGLPKKTTITDRSIVIQLRRKLANESVERLPADLVESCEKIRRQAQRWANDHQETLKKAAPVLPDCENDRALDNWRPIFQIAETAGGDWPDLARQSFGALTEVDSDDAPGPLLLHDIREIFETVGRDRIFSRDLLDLLIENSESPWATWHRGKPISARALCRQLTPYGVRSHGTIRVGGHTSKGYLLSSFQDAFQRYLPEKTASLPATTISSVTTSQVNNDGASSRYLSVTQGTNVTDKKRFRPSNGAGCDVVTDKTRGEGDGNIFRGLTAAILDCVEKLPKPTIADLVRSIYRANDPTEPNQRFAKIRARVGELVSEGRIVHQGTGYKLVPDPLNLTETKQ